MRIAITCGLFTLLAVVGCAAGGAQPASPPSVARQVRSQVAPRAAHVTVVVMENRNYNLVVGNGQAPYFNRVLVPQGILLRNSHAVTHPSEPNYVALFSGSTQGLTDDSCPHLYSAQNVASQLIAAGKTFAGYSESMPRDGFRGCYTANNLYARKHVPWVDFRNVPASSNLVYHGLPQKMPSLAWITPNLCNDMHDCSTKTGDNWLRANLPKIIAWDARNDGLLIVTWDEADPDNDGSNRIPTVLVGPMVRAGAIDRQNVSHYGVLHTIETMFGLPCLANACKAPVVTGIWN